MVDDPKVREWKRRLLAKGGEVAKQLEDLLAGKDVDLSAGIPEFGTTDKELRLRRFLDLIDRGIKRADTGRFGRCAVCGESLPPAVLDERPWTERCTQHATT